MCGCVQANMVKQLTKLVKVRYVDDVSSSVRIGTPPPSMHCMGFLYALHHADLQRMDARD